MSNTDNPRRALAIAIAMGAHFCNINSTEDAVAAFERLEQLANADVDADPSGCGFPAWRAIEGECASDVFDNVEGLLKHILAAFAAPAETPAPVVIVTVGGGNVQDVLVQGHADVFILDFDNGREGDPGEHPEIPGYDGARASIWDAGGVNTADAELVARIQVLAEREPSTALAAVIERHGDQQWSLIDGPETGRGVEFWYENQAQTHQVYVCIDQDEVVSCELHELEEV
jgi:hypothetical protein